MRIKQTAKALFIALALMLPMLSGLGVQDAAADHILKPQWGSLYRSGNQMIAEAGFYCANPGQGCYARVAIYENGVMCGSATSGTSMSGRFVVVARCYGYTDWSSLRTFQAISYDPSHCWTCVQAYIGYPIRGYFNAY